jgi:hypothetical protein
MLVKYTYIMPNSLPPLSPVLVGGSRSLAASPILAHVVQQLALAGASFRVGCASGADAQALAAAVAAGAANRLSVFAVGTSSGFGFWDFSALPAVRAAQRAGARVSWLAGGPLSLPLSARLIRRSLAALSGCSLAVFFLAGRVSPGSAAVAARAVAARVPVFAFCPVQPAPLLVAGCWVPSSLFGLACWSWSSAQTSLF